MEDKEFKLTITCNKEGIIKMEDSREPERKELGNGLLLILGDARMGVYSNFVWGSAKSIVHGFYGGILDARESQGEEGPFYRHVFREISMLISQLYGHVQPHGVITTEEALQKFNKEDSSQGGNGGSTH